MPMLAEMRFMLGIDLPPIDCNEAMIGWFSFHNRSPRI